jgi:hypothetical protein
LAKRNQPCCPSEAKREHGGKDGGDCGKIDPAQNQACQLKGEEYPSEIADGLRNVVRQASQVPGKKSRKEQVGTDVESKPTIESSITETGASDREGHAVHCGENGRSFRSGRFEVQKSKGVTGREQDEEDCRNPIEPDDFHFNSSNGENRFLAAIAMTVATPDILL